MIWNMNKPLYKLLLQECLSYMLVYLHPAVKWHCHLCLLVMRYFSSVMKLESRRLVLCILESLLPLKSTRKTKLGSLKRKLFWQGLYSYEKLKHYTSYDLLLSASYLERLNDQTGLHKSVCHTNGNSNHSKSTTYEWVPFQDLVCKSILFCFQVQWGFVGLMGKTHHHASKSKTSACRGFPISRASSVPQR